MSTAKTSLTKPQVTRTRKSFSKIPPAMELPNLISVQKDSFKHFMTDGAQHVPFTLITREYPQQWQRGSEAYYPIRTTESERIYNEYVAMAREEYPNIVFGGRLGLFRYLDMDDTIAAAIEGMNNTGER